MAISRRLVDARKMNGTLCANCGMLDYLVQMTIHDDKKSLVGIIIILNDDNVEKESGETLTNLREMNTKRDLLN